MLSELITRDSSLYSQHLLGLVRHSLSMARQKELAPVHITPRQAQVLSFSHLVQRCSRKVHSRDVA